MKILIACEYSGIVRDEFIQRGHDAISCDLLPTEKPGPHYQGSVLDILYQDWDMIIAHPPCTYLCNSRVRWLYTDLTRWDKLDSAAKFFNLFLNHKCKRIAIENPVMHKHAVLRVKGSRKFIKEEGKNYSQKIQPWQFGHPESKATCLWLKGLPLLQETDNVKDIYKSLPKSEAQRIHYASPGEARSKIRSKTFEGIAKGMANQWG